MFICFWISPLVVDILLTYISLKFDSPFTIKLSFKYIVPVIVGLIIFGYTNSLLDNDCVLLHNTIVSDTSGIFIILLFCDLIDLIIGFINVLFDNVSVLFKVDILSDISGIIIVFLKLGLIDVIYGSINVLLYKISYVFLQIKVSFVFGKYTIPSLLIDLIIGLINVLFSKICSLDVFTKISFFNISWFDGNRNLSFIFNGILTLNILSIISILSWIFIFPNKFILLLKLDVILTLKLFDISILLLLKIILSFIFILFASIFPNIDNLLFIFPITIWLDSVIVDP